MNQKIINFISKSKLAIILAYTTNNYLQWAKLKLIPKKTSNSATTTSKINLDYEIKKNEEEYNIYSNFIKNPKNKNILEIGTGAFNLNAIKFLNQDVSLFHSIDRFYCLKPIKDQIKMNNYFLEKNKIKKYSSYYDKKTAKFNSNKYTYKQIDFMDYKTNIKYDYIISYAVLEHIENISNIAKNAHKLMNSEGKFIAMIGNDDHGMFTINKSFSTYEYYTIPDFIYWNMTALSGRPNRRIPLEYIKDFKKAGFKKVEIYILKDNCGKYYTDKLIKYQDMKIEEFEKRNELVKIKTKFIKRYKNKPLVEFIPDYFILVAEK